MFRTAVINLRLDSRLHISSLKSGGTQRTPRRIYISHILGCRRRVGARDDMLTSRRPIATILLPYRAG